MSCRPNVCRPNVRVPVWDHLIVRLYNIRVARRPITTLRHLLTNVEDKEQPHDRKGAVYKIKCADCHASYIDETDRNLNTRLTEHKQATQNGDRTNHIVEHHRQTKHNIDWDSTACRTYSTNYKQRLALERWFTYLEEEPLSEPDFHIWNANWPMKCGAILYFSFSSLRGLVRQF